MAAMNRVVWSDGLDAMPGNGFTGPRSGVIMRRLEAVFGSGSTIKTREWH